jgi:hypothetical protein
MAVKSALTQVKHFDKSNGQCRSPGWWVIATDRYFLATGQQRDGSRRTRLNPEKL